MMEFVRCPNTKENERINTTECKACKYYEYETKFSIRCNCKRSKIYMAMAYLFREDLNPHYISKRDRYGVAVGRMSDKLPEFNWNLLLNEDVIKKQRNQNITNWFLRMNKRFRPSPKIWKSALDVKKCEQVEEERKKELEEVNRHNYLLLGDGIALAEVRERFKEITNKLYKRKLETKKLIYRVDCRRLGEMLLLSECRKCSYYVNESIKFVGCTYPNRKESRPRRIYRLKKGEL